MKTSPTQRTLAALRAMGYTAQVVERWNQFAHVRQDLFGGIDVVAIHPDHDGVLGVQATVTGSLSNRRKKLEKLPALKLWLQCGNRLELWGWSKKGKRGKRKMWQLTVKEMTVL